MKALPRGDWTNAEYATKGTWVPYTRDGKKTARVCCLLCGFVYVLDGCLIGGEGAVGPSADCPVSTCRFHDFVKLGGWIG